MLALLLAFSLQDPVPATPTPSPQIPAAAPTEIPVGKGELTLAIGDVPLQVFTYRPAAWHGARMLLVLHGVLRNADEYRDHAVGMGDRFDALIVAPKFDAERFPSRRYQRGGIVAENGTAAPPHEWTYAMIPQIAARMRELSKRDSLPFWIIGHSAGGQFTMRMAAFQDTGAVRLVAANPGTDLFPTRSLPFGHGFGSLPPELSDDAQLQRYLAAPLTIYLGTADDVPDENFDTSPEGMAQGAGRHQRGLACYWTARTLAEVKGWRFGWQLVEAPGVEHDHEKMFAHASCEVALFGPKPAAAGSNGAK
jgi:pimeloyl-ACP methyl ester carboxylesterase